MMDHELSKALATIRNHHKLNDHEWTAALYKHQLIALLNSVLKSYLEIVALSPDTKNPDFMLALGNKNPADNTCLKNACSHLEDAIYALQDIIDICNGPTSD